MAEKQIMNNDKLSEILPMLREQFDYTTYTNVSSSWYNDPMYYKEGERRYRPSEWW